MCIVHIIHQVKPVRNKKFGARLGHSLFGVAIAIEASLWLKSVMKTDIEISNAATLRPILDIAEKLGINADSVEPYGRFKAKLNIATPTNEVRSGKLILVTAINPTPAGEGKTTTSVGLADALNLIGRKTVLALREPSLGPCFGTKGGATGGGYAQVAPMADINLHFTGDFHAITAAHNLLAALIDNHIHWGNALSIDVRRIVWRRVMDVNDRALRDIVQSIGGVANGFPRESGFDITVASEVMAIFCLARDIGDLEERLGQIVIGYTSDRRPVTARDLKADGAMTVLLAEAIKPNLVQTLEGNPAILHGGPFANIAHGCNSVIATKAALSLGDYVVTEAGFGADLGAEKFFDIKCRQSGLAPSAVVIVATVRALKMNGGVAKTDLAGEDAEAVQRGSINLIRHIENIRQFGVPAVVAINHFTTDTDAEIGVIQSVAAEHGCKAIVCYHWADGGRGAQELAHEVAALADSDAAQFAPIYDDNETLFDKMNIIATRIYRASAAVADPSVLRQLAAWEDAGYGHLPVCMAKTQYSFSTDPAVLGAPTGHVVPVREVRLSAGAGFVVAVCGEIMTMPGLPRVPAAEGIGINAQGDITGLF
jgi:formate--tetrahydrofolate ligase